MTSRDLKGARVVVLTALFNDWTSLMHLLPKLDAELASLGVNATLVVVDDGSTEEWERDDAVLFGLKAITHIEVVVLGCNQGNQRAVTVGMAYVTTHYDADYVLVMDCDLEDKPEYVPVLLKTCAERGGRQIVFAERTKRSEGRAFAVFYRLCQTIYRMLTGTPISMGNFSVVPMTLARRLVFVAELWNHYPGAILRSRLPFTAVPTERGRRLSGRSSMNWVRLVAHAFSGLSTHSEVVAVRLIGGTIGLTGLIAVVIVGLIFLKLMTEIPAVGWTTTVIANVVVLTVQMMVSAVILLFIMLSQRLNIPMVPIRDFAKLILRVDLVRQGQPAKIDGPDVAFVAADLG